MHKRDYFLAAMKAGCYRYKQWVIEAFSITKPLENDTRPYPYALVPKNGFWYFLNPETNEMEQVEGTYKDEPAFHFKDELVLAVGDLPNVKKNVTTTYGNVLFNQTVLVYAFGDKVEYMTGPIKVSAVEKIIEKRLQDEPKDGQPRDPNALYVSEYRRFNEAILSLAGYTQLCVPSATPRSLTTDPQIRVRRKELLEEYKDRLHDPVVLAKIDAELVAMDKAWIKGDPAEGFYIKDKSYNVVRKKTFLMQGVEQGFDIKSDVIPQSLDEGWDIKYLPAMGNALREGSYSRGALTALGGEAVKFNYRIFQNSRVTEEDCGSNMGLPVDVTEQTASWYINSTAITDKGQVLITEENLKQFVGKSVKIRSPIYCKTSDANFCATCIGKEIATTPDALGTYSADFGSQMMSRMMSAMHGKALQLSKWKIGTIT